MSKDGYVKPTILVDPIELSGVVIKRTSGFNADYIVKNKIIQGTKVHIKRSGDVIPYIVKVVNEKPVKDDENFILLKTLPPDIIWEWNETRKDIISTNNSDEKNFKTLQYFYTKIKIPSLSEGTLRKMYNKGYKKPIDVYNMNINELTNIIGEKMAIKVSEGRVETFKNTTFKDIMIASNVFGRSIGEKKIDAVCSTIDCYDIVRKPNKKVLIEDLVEIDGVSTKTGSLFLQGIELFKEFIIDNPFPILGKEVNGKSVKEGKEGNEGKEVKEVVINEFKNKRIEKKTFLFTGVRDKNLEKYVEENGGKISNTFNKNVDVLVIKDDTTNNKKVEKAIKDGIEILTVEQLRNFI